MIGEIRLGLNASSDYLRLLPMTQALVDDCPGISIHMVSSSTGKIIEQLLADKLDIGFVFGEVDSALITAHQLADAQLFIGLPTNMAKDANQLDWADLAELPWIYTDYYCPFQNQMEQIFTEQNLEPKQKVLSNDEQTRLELVRSGVGASLLMKDVSQNALDSGEVLAYPNYTAVLPLQLAYRTDKAQDPLIKPVVQTILQIWVAN